ncbi:hypothetical protein [Chengkuizengella sediminis]|uniref:hypothetical protein n=1 Tax=Chengkuizengella sediminis TaxID=1885917 RepID=UPI001389BCF3|nr:hypothetical protein [Chengkuizengella sediminis]
MLNCFGITFICCKNKVVVFVERFVIFHYHSFENVYLEGLTKQVPEISQRHKVDSDGNLLYLLPQEPMEIQEEFTKTIETTEITENPVMVNTPTQIPIFNDDGTQKQYERTVRGETTEVTDEPLMEKVWDEENEVYNDVHKVDEDGTLLYWGQVGTGQMINCYTVEQILNQKEDPEGNLLYYKEVTETSITYEDQEPLEITQDDERWTEELAPALEDIEQIKMVKFEDQPSLFTYEDILNAPKTPLTAEQEIELLKSENATLILDSLQKESQIEALESENATQFLNSLEKETQIEELETELAGLTLSLVEGGVI